jgi:magnesium-transporting ATPase (P-type)
VPFGSAWRWSGIDLPGGSHLLGAPELLDLGPLAAEAERLAGEGRRVVAFAEALAPVGAIDPRTAGSPPPHHVLGLVVLAEQLRAEARETVEFFHSQGVELKVLSGDRPETVAAIARDVGIPVNAAVDGSQLPDDPDALSALAAEATVIGRISPDGKRRIVEALRDQGRYVAMVGDGVNDVPALKAARLAIAQGSGAQMAKSVADIVLVSGDFAAVPLLVDEGRKILRNLQRVAKLFVSKSAFATFLILSIGISPVAYPLLPRHLTLVASLTIGIPGFFLALAPSTGSFRSGGFLREVGRFAVPAGVGAGLAVLSSYTFALEVLDLPLIEARTVATTALVLVGLYLIVALEASGRHRSAWVGTLCAAMLASFAATVAVPFTRDFFALAVPSPLMVLTAATGAVLAVVGLWLTGEQFEPGGGESGRLSGR